MSTWEVYAVKYAERTNRTRADSFIFDDNHDAPHAIDYYMWLLRCEGGTILVDTGYDGAEATARGRPIRLEPVEALKPFEIAPVDRPKIVQLQLTSQHPTQDKPEVILDVPDDPNRVSAFLNIRVADIVHVYEDWSARGATFLTPPIDRGARRNSPG